MLWVGVKPLVLKPFLPPPIARESGCEDGPVARGLCFYPGTRAWRGPLRRCSLEPDTWAVVPFRFGQPRADPQRTVRTARVRRAAPARYATFRIAPVGTTPVVAYRHNAITNLRASATIPIRRARFPTPNRVRYH